MIDLDTGVLYCSDNLERLSTLPSASVDLVYLDPPFFSNRTYEVIWGDEAEVRSFEDRWEGGIQVYISWMRDRMVQLHRVLKPTGSLYLHCDPHASHYLKVMLDQVFGGSEYFRSEVIWKRTGSHNSARRWGPLHDVILFYTKSSKIYTWNVQHQPYDPSYIETSFRMSDDRGLFQPVSLTGPGRRNGESGKRWRNFNPTDGGRHWQPPTMMYDLYERITGEGLADLPLLERLDRADAAGLIYWPTKSGGGVPRFKQYLHLSPGQAVQDVITDIPPLGATAAERLGYPTQKPESLLERIIGSSSNKDEIVLDPFCGCGTTVRAADKLGRRYVGIDISPTAVRIMGQRMRPARIRPRIIGMPTTVDDLRALKPFEFQNWVVEQYYGRHSPRKSNDLGIDGYTFFTNDPIQVKQSDHVGRNVIDNFQTAMRRGGHTKGYVVAFSFTKNAREEVARALWEDRLEIELVTVEKLAASKPEDRFPLTKPGKLIKLPDMAPARPKEARPTAEELIASDRRAG